MTTRTRTRDLDSVLAAVADAGFPLTEQEKDIVRRRLAPRGTFRGRPDPLSGTERDAVAAVDHIFDERGGALARGLEGPPPLTELFDGYRAENEEESDLEAEVARLRAENEALRAGGPQQAALIEQVRASSAGPLAIGDGPEFPPTPARVGEPDSGTDTSGETEPEPETAPETKGETTGATETKGGRKP